MSQPNYALELLQYAGMTKCTRVSTRMASSNKLSATNGTLFSSDDSTGYRNIVGGLRCLTRTRLNFSFVVNKVCQYLHAPPCSQWSAVKCILYYVHATLSHGMLLWSATTFPELLFAFSDADWTGNSDDR
jgi:hypothetical protein